MLLELVSCTTGNIPAVPFIAVISMTVPRCEISLPVAFIFAGAARCGSAADFLKRLGRWGGGQCTTFHGFAALQWQCVFHSAVLKIVT